MDQFILDFDDWLAHRGENLLASVKMIRKCRPALFEYWRKWLLAQRVADGLDPHVPMIDTPEMA